MGAARAHTDPAQPPRHGPYAAADWDADSGHWRVRLRPEAAELVEDYLRKYPRPVSVVARRWPNVIQAARGRGLSWDDLHEAALAGVARAAVLYDPDRGASFATYAGIAARDAIRRESLPRAGQPARFLRPDQFVRGEEGWAGWDGLGVEAREGEFEEETAADRLDRVRRYLARLGSREQDLVARYYGLDGQGGTTLAALAGRHGVTRERCRQIIARAVARARHALAGRD